MTWYTTGKRPARNLEAALVGGAVGFFTAWLAGKPRPWVYATAQAVGSASAMNRHRISERINANRRNSDVAKQMGDIANSLLSAVSQSLPHGVQGEFRLSRSSIGTL
jgi:hypothetical protein